MNKKNIQLFAAVMWAVATLIWVALTVAHLVLKTPVYLPMLTAIAAVTAFVAFVVNCLRWRRMKEE